MSAGFSAKLFRGYGGWRAEDVEKSEILYISKLYWKLVLSDKKSYKSYELYCCFALNRLVGELEIDIYQNDLENKIESVLKNQKGISKGEIKYEIKTNNHMTNKVLKKLENDDLIEIEQSPKKYNIKITEKGILHVRKFNEFYWQMFNEHVKEHYKYRGIPIWFERLK